MDWRPIERPTVVQIPRGPGAGMMRGMTGNDLSSRRWLILLSTVVSFFSVGVTFFAVPPLIPELVGRFGLSQLAIGVLMGAISVPAILASIPLGAAVDRWPARATGNAALTLMTVGALFFALAPNYAVLLIGRFLFGVGGLIINLLLARLVSTAFAGRELSLAMGTFNAVYPASMIVMFSLHPKLLAAFGWRGELSLLAVMVVVAIPLHNAAVPRGLRGEAVSASPATERWLSPPLIALAFSWLLFFAAYASIFTFAPEWAGGGTAALLTVSLIPWIAIFLGPISGLAIDRTGRAARWVLVGQLLLAGALAGMASNTLSPVIAMLMVGVAFATVSTATYSMPARLVPAARVGFAFGFITAFSNFGNLFGPALAGAIQDFGRGWVAVWAVLAVCAVLGALAASRLPVTGSRVPEPSE